MMKYKIVVEPVFSEFLKQVDISLIGGWKCLGGPTWSPSGLVQAMTKNDKEKVE